MGAGEECEWGQRSGNKGRVPVPQERAGRQNSCMPAKGRKISNVRALASASKLQRRPGQGTAVPRSHRLCPPLVSADNGRGVPRYGTREGDPAILWENS
jgi:hypothetical protein